MHAADTWTLRISQSAEQDVLVLAVAGRLGFQGAGVLVERVVQVIDAGHRLVLLDLEGVDYVSSAGLVAIDALAGRLYAAGGRLALCCVCEPVRLVLDVAGLLQDIPVEPSRASGVARLRS